MNNWRYTNREVFGAYFKTTAIIVSAVIIIIAIASYVYSINSNNNEQSINEIVQYIPSQKLERDTPPFSPSITQPQINTNELEMRIHELTNQERAKYGMTPVQWDDVISNVARDHSSDMAINNYFEHTDSKGIDAPDRGIINGYVQCGDLQAVQLSIAYENDRKRFESTGNTDQALYNKLQQNYNELNKLNKEKKLHQGFSENIFQNNLYSSITYINGVPNYHWNSLEEIAKTTVEGWMKSPGHRENLLGYHTSEGIGVAIASDDKVYITQNFC
jgi:uncharacterized protein YkwD